MKKTAFLSVLLSLLLSFQTIALPVSAAANLLDTVPDESAVSEQTQPTTADPYADVDIPFGQVSVLNGCRTIAGKVPLAGSERKLDSAQAVFAYEVETETVVYSYNPDAKLSPGTLTKLVTALLAVELCDLEETVVVSSRNISRLPAGSQNEKLKEGEELSVKDLVHCLILHSANDAAIALAEHISGNQQGFLVLMNDRVKQMGCTQTEFNNVHGLDNATNYTTARDMARIMVAATKNEQLHEIMKTAKYTVPATNRSEERPLITQNYLIDQSVVPQFFDTRVTGGLQSMTDVSGASMVATAEWNNLNMVFVVLGALRIYNEEKSWVVETYGNLNEMIDLMEYVFNNFKVNRILYDGQALTQFTVAGGECDVVGQPKVNYDSVLPKEVTMDNLILDESPVGGGLSAPIYKDDMIATVQVKYRNSCIAEAELYAMSNVRTTEKNGVAIESNETKSDNDASGFFNVLGTICVLILGAIGLYLFINYIRRMQAQKKRRRRRANRRRSY